MKDERAGRATFLPLDTVQGSAASTAACPSAAECSPADLVKCDPRYQQIIVSNLLGRIIVVEDLSTRPRAVARQRWATATVSSRWTARSSTRAARSPAAPLPAASGVFSRKQEIDELQHQAGQALEKAAGRRGGKNRTGRKAEVDSAFRPAHRRREPRPSPRRPTRLRGAVESGRIA